MSDVCKTCEAPILWAFTEKNARMPLDAQPQRLFTLEPDPARPGQQLARSTLVYTSHFVTCQDRDQHRRPR